MLVVLEDKMEAVSKVYHDESLYGHALTSLPGKIWSNIYFQGERVVLDNYFIYKNVVWKEQNPTKFTITTEILGEKFICYLLGGLVTFLASITLAPIGFTAKVAHKVAQTVLDKLLFPL